MSSASELESSLISFAGSNSYLALSTTFTAMESLAGNPVGVGEGAIIRGLGLF